MAIRYADSVEGVDWERAAQILHEAGLTQADADHIKQVFTNSRYVSLAYDEDKLVGVSRAISDGIDQGAIYNVAVDASYQGYGLGRGLIAFLLEQMKGQNVILYTHPQTIAYYETLGFRRNKSAMCYFDTDEEHKAWMSEQGFFLPEGFRFADEYGRKDMQYEKPHRKEINERKTI